MLVVTGTVTAQPETFAELRQAALDHVGRSRTEPGCLTHGVAIDCEAPLTLVFYEEWADRAALDLHFAQEGSLAFMRAVRSLCASSTKVRILPVEDRPPAEGSATKMAGPGAGFAPGLPDLTA